MNDPINPYASPLTTQMDPVAVQWLGAPSASLTKVANGLGLIYSGIVLALLSAIGGGILVAVIAIATRSEALVGLFGILMVVGIIIAAILNIVGTLFCTAAPEESGAQGMIYASAAAMAISLVLSIGAAIGLVPHGMSIIQNIASIVSGITFLIFLRRLGLFIGRQDLADKAQSILMWCIGLVVASIAALAIMVGSAGMAFFRAAAAGDRAAPDLGNAGGGIAVGGLLMLIVAIAALVTFVRYANLLTYMRKAILGGGRG